MRGMCVADGRTAGAGFLVVPLERQTEEAFIDRFESFGRGDSLLVVDVFNDFVHEDGDRLLASFRDRAPTMEHVVAAARQGGVPVIYVNDGHARWDGDVRRLVADALNG